MSKPDEQLRNAIGHLRALLDVLGPCENFDHHGYCQSHFIESPCRVDSARKWLEALPNKTDLKDDLEAVIVPTDKLQKIFAALDESLGDTDPDILEDATDDEIRDEEPVFWAAREIAKIIYNKKRAK